MACRMRASPFTMITPTSTVEGATKCFYEIGFCDGGGAAGAGRDAARIFVNPIRNDGHNSLLGSENRRRNRHVNHDGD